MGDGREGTLEVLKEQEADIRKCEREQENFVTSMNKQREYMNFMLNGELSFLKKTGSKDETEPANEGKVEDAEQSQSETAQAEDQEGTVVTIDANEDNNTTSFATEEEANDEADVNERGIIIGVSALEIENIILKEAAGSIKEAMEAAGNLVEQDGGEHDDGSSEESETPLLKVTNMGPVDHTDEKVEKEEEEIPDDKKEEHKLVDLVSYSTPVFQEEGKEEATIGAIISAASSDDSVNADESIDPSQEEDEDGTVIPADLSTASSNDDGNVDEMVDPLLQLPSSVE